MHTGLDANVIVALQYGEHKEMISTDLLTVEHLVEDFEKYMKVAWFKTNRNLFSMALAYRNKQMEYFEPRSPTYRKWYFLCLGVEYLLM